MSEDLKGPFIRWLNYGYEGWKPSSFQTLKEAIEAQRYGEEMVITKRVKWDVVLVHDSSA